MSTSFKKLLLVSITLLLGVMSSGAMAQTTNYDFSFSGNNSYSITGMFGVTSGVITSISGTVTAPNSYNGAIQFLIPPGGFAGNDNMYFPAGPYLNYDGVSFQTSGGTLNLYYDSGSTYLLGDNNTDISAGSMTSSISGGVAPEMNASLIPQVGLLLGCLFFLFGRKREVVEPMLVV